MSNKYARIILEADIKMKKKNLEKLFLELASLSEEVSSRQTSIKRIEKEVEQLTRSIKELED